LALFLSMLAQLHQTRIHCCNFFFCRTVSVQAVQNLHYLIPVICFDWIVRNSYCIRIVSVWNPALSCQ
jgi:hypothetical protein